MRENGDCATCHRFFRFQAVGVVGIWVQLGVLAALTEGFGMQYLAATGMAVEAAVLHNFLWHERWTWRERTRGAAAGETLARLLRFHLSTGLGSILANLFLMRLLVGGLGLAYLPANLLAIALCAAANFAASEWFAFAPERERGRKTSAGGRPLGEIREAAQPAHRS